MTHTLNLSGAQVEHLLDVLSEVDLAPVVQCFSGGSFLDLFKLLPMLKQAKAKRLFRRLGGIFETTAEELIAAELDESKWAAIEAKGAARSWEATKEDLAAFFGGLGLSVSDTPASLAMVQMLMKTDPAPGPDPGPSPSEG